jgi:hypothetical protein
VKQPDTGPGADPNSWAQAVSRAEDHLRDEALAGPTAGRPLPGRTGLILIAGLVVAAAVAVVSPRLVGAPRVDLPAVEQAADLRAEVGRLVEQIEAYRQERGTLPAPAMLAPFLDEGYEYRVTDRNALRYEVRRAAGGVEVVYDGSLPLNLWLVVGGLSETDGR